MLTLSNWQSKQRCQYPELLESCLNSKCVVISLTKVLTLADLEDYSTYLTYLSADPEKSPTNVGYKKSRKRRTYSGVVMQTCYPYMKNLYIC